MQCLITALKAESEPLIQHLGLQRDKSFPFPFFRNDDICLIATGVGKKNINNRISFIVDIFNKKDISFINIGIAGGNRSYSKIGDIFLINKIIDQETSRVFYPDIIFKNDLNEASITTVPNVVTDGNMKFDSLVDMESSEIFRVCSKYVSLHKIIILKIVSDHMDLKADQLNYKEIFRMIKKKAQVVDYILDCCIIIEKINQSILSDSDFNWIKKTNLILTDSQKNELKKKVIYYRIRNPKHPLPDIVIPHKISKKEQKTILKNIYEILTS